MRKIIILWLLVFALVGAASLYASITLSPTQIQTFGQNSVIETNDTAAVTSVNIDFQGKTINAVLVFGTMSNGVFTRGLHGTSVNVSIDATTGTWNTTNSTNGTLTAGQLTSVQTALKNLRNNLENISLAMGATAGTQVAW